MRKPPLVMMELPLEVRAEMALKAAVEQAIKEHAREGRPIYVGENDEVVEITAAELRNLYPDYPRDC